MNLINDFKIRRLEERDLKLVLDWRNQLHIRENMYTDHIISWEEHVAWFHRVELHKNSEYFILEIKEIPAGFLSIVDIDKKNGKCYWGFYIGDISAPRGSGSIFEFLALNYIFNELHIRKLYCEVFAFNEKVIKLHKKFGFKQEGLFREHILKNNKYEDVVSLALFRNEYVETFPSIEKRINRI